MHCSHERLIKVIDQIGVMTVGSDGQYRAPVLRAHYECDECGVVVQETQAPRSAWTEFDYEGAIDKIGTALDAIHHARQAINGRRDQSKER